MTFRVPGPTTARKRFYELLCRARNEIKTRYGWKGNAMKLAVSSTGPELQDLVDPRFGRCRYYIFYNMDTGLLAARENTAGLH